MATNLNTAKYWNQKWREQGAFYAGSPDRDHVYTEIFRRLAGNVRPKAVFLDAGGGLSRLSVLAKELGFRPYVLDISSLAIMHLRSTHNIPGVVCNIDRWTPNQWFGDFEFATATEIIEHLEDPERLMMLLGKHTDHAFLSAPTHEAPPLPGEHLRTYDVSLLSEFLATYWEQVEVRQLDQNYLFAEVSQWHKSRF